MEVVEEFSVDVFGLEGCCLVVCGLILENIDGFDNVFVFCKFFYLLNFSWMVLYGLSGHVFELFIFLVMVVC